MEGPMNSRERILTTLRHQQADRVPIADHGQAAARRIPGSLSITTASCEAS